MGERLDIARTRSWIGHAPEMRLFQRDELRITRHASRKSIGQALGNGKRQNRECIRATKPGAEHRRRGPQDIRMGIKPRHHPPRSFAMQPQRLLHNPARFQHSRPEQPDGAEFRQCQEHVLIGGKCGANNVFR